MIVGIGIDVAEIARIAAVLDRHGERFLRRVLTEGERAYCLRHRAPAAHVAGRFAAKEAALKALGTGLSSGIGWRDVEVVRRPGGAPALALHGRAGEIAKGRGVRRTHLSLTHDRGIAAAVVILEGGGR